MKLNDLYIPYENKIVENFFKHIIEKFKSEERAPYIDKNLQPREDEYLELVNINYPSEYINIQRRFDNPEKWNVTFLELRNAIKFTLRKGSIQGSGDYNKMTGTSNFVGTPLHILIALVQNDEYKKVSIVGKQLKHPKFGLVLIEEIEFVENVINILVGESIKKIKMDFWEITELDFNKVFNEPAA